MYNLLLKNPLILRLSIVQFLAYFGAWFSNVAIYTMILKFEVSPIINAIVVSMYALPALLAPFNGAIVDKYLSKKFMITLLIAEFFMTLSYLLIQNNSQVWLLIIFIYIRTSATLMFFNAQMSLLPKILKEDELKKANSLHSIIWSVTFAFGMAIGGVIIDKFGIYTTIKIDSLLFILAIIIFSTIRFKLPTNDIMSIKTLIKDGFLYLRSDKKTLHLIFIHASVALTTFDTLINLLTNSNYKYVIAIPLAIGWLNATRAIGLVVGPFIIGDRVNEKNLYIFFILQGLTIIIWALVQKSFYMSMLMMFFIGFFTTTLWSYTYTLIQNRISTKYLGRVLAYNEMIYMGSGIIVTLFTGFAYKYGLSLFSISMILGLGFFVVGIYYKSSFKKG
ncbi:MAG: MFS transporter [Epsilonproteobacteria bacterium]|nr:MFS transporter [Campylobacterota bacterium]